MDQQAPAKTRPGSAIDPERAGLAAELRRLSERIAALESAQAETERRTARLIERILGALCDYRDPCPPAAPQAGENCAIGRAEPVTVTGSFPSSQSDSAAFARLAAALAEADRAANSRPSGILSAEQLEAPADDIAPPPPEPPREAPPAARRKQLPDAPPDIGIPPPEEKDWNVWVTPWVLAEQRAEILGIQNVPPFSSMLFSPGGGQEPLDAWRSLHAGGEVLREAGKAEFADEQIKKLIRATLEKYESELEFLRKQSPWHACLRRLRESLHVLAAISTSETQAEVIKGEACLDKWHAFMDEHGGWVSKDSAYVEKIALCICALYDKLSDRPGSRQSQFSIETKADMATYNAMRACEVFLAQMNVTRDKELMIGKPYDALLSSKLRDHHTPLKGLAPTPGKSLGVPKIARIMRSRWVLTAGDGREQGELVKASYELE